MYEIYKAIHGNHSGKIKTNVTRLRSLKARAKSFPLYLQCLAQVRHMASIRGTSSSGCYLSESWDVVCFQCHTYLPGSRFQTERSYNCPCF